MHDRRVETLPGGRAVLAEHGPLRLVIQAFSGEKPEIKFATEAAYYGFECLARVAGEMPLLRQRHPLILGTGHDEIASTMIENVRRIGDEDLTPMAAVAGTIADFVADYLFRDKITRVIVDNGGDIAIRLQPGEVVRVGFRPVITSQEISHLIQIDARKLTWGVNTSGLGGRSLTRGIASGVTAFAETSSRADAAATAIANSCFAGDDNIQQVPANTLDPNTDLGDTLVTLNAVGISSKTEGKALGNGLLKAEQLVRRGAIRGAVIAVGGKFELTSRFTEQVGDISRYKDTK